jgi:hypothetical protein
VAENIVAIRECQNGHASTGSAADRRRWKSKQAVLGSLFTAGSVEGLGMKVAAYVRPGIFPQGLLWNEVWIDILGRMLQSLWADGARSDEYLRRRLAASRTLEDPIAFSVPIGDTDRLRRARIGEAPEPIVEPLSSSLDEIAEELADSRSVIGAIHGSTGRQITAPMRALTRAYRAALGKVRPVCRRGAATCDRASKPSFGNMTAYTAKQEDRPVIG